MKSKTFTVSLSLLFSSLTSSMACVYYGPMPNTSSIFRLSYEDNDPYSPEHIKDRNLLLWQQDTGLSRTDISWAVYGDDRWDYSRRLQQLLPDHPDAVHLLELAYRCQEARQQMRSAWYYAIDGDEPQSILQDVAEESIRTFQAAIESTENPPSTIQQRYCIQAVRALFSLHDYERCLSFWEEADAHVTAPVLRDLTLPYIMGCHTHLGEPQKAIGFYLDHGDLESATLCLQAINKLDIPFEDIVEIPENTCLSQDAAFLLAARYCPESPMAAKYIEAVVDHIPSWTDRHMDGDPIYDQFRMPSEDTPVHLEEAIRVASTCQGPNRVLWCYAAAALSEASDRPEQAVRWLDKAKESGMTSRMAEYIRVFDDYLYFKYAEIDSLYYARISEEISWMDEQMQLHLSPNRVANRHFNSLGYDRWASEAADEADYWNLCIRRLLITDISRRIADKNPQMALRLTNYAENRFPRLCDGFQFEPGDRFLKYSTAFSYEKSVFFTKRDRWIFSQQYSTALFNLTESLSADILVEYYNWLQSEELTGFDALLRDNSLLLDDYWKDIIGTHFLREGRWKLADSFLSGIPERFYDSTNFLRDGDYVTREPFSTDPRDRDYTLLRRFRQSYAHRMVELQKSQDIPDADTRADFLLQMSIGIRNSISHCWYLTSYGWSWYLTDPKDNIIGADHFGGRLLKESKRLEDLALRSYDTDDRKAQALCRLNRRWEVMAFYPETPTAAYLEKHCDLWRDYAQAHSY